MSGVLLDRTRIRDPLGGTQLTSLALNDAGEIVAADQFGGAHVRRIDPGFSQSTSASQPAVFVTPTGIAVRPDRMTFPFLGLNLIKVSDM